jgi:hypothetical protein
VPHGRDESYLLACDSNRKPFEEIADRKPARKPFMAPRCCKIRRDPPVGKLDCSTVAPLGLEHRMLKKFGDFAIAPILEERMGVDGILPDRFVGVSQKALLG